MLCLGYYITEEFYNIVNKSIENNMNLCVLGRCISKKIAKEYLMKSLWIVELRSKLLNIEGKTLKATIERYIK